MEGPAPDGDFIGAFQKGAERVKESVVSKLKKFTHIRSVSAPVLAPRIKLPRPDEENTMQLKGLEALYDSEDVRNKSFDTILESAAK